MTPRNLNSLSVVIPAFNESSTIMNGLPDILKFLNTYYNSPEIIIVDDGSTDGTYSAAQKVTEGIDNVKLFRNEKNEGKGFSVKKGILASSGEYILLTDADFQIDIDVLPAFIEELEHGADIAIASRQLSSSVLQGKQDIFRLLARKVLSSIVRNFLIPTISDSQCGFKCFRGTAAKQIFRNQNIKGFGFDIEILFNAYTKGMLIKELPVKWHSSKSTKVRLLPDSYEVLKDIIKIKISESEKKRL